MSHGGYAQEKPLSFEGLLLISELSLWTEKCLLLIVKTSSGFAVSMVSFPSMSHEVKEDMSRTCVDVFLKVSLPVCHKHGILPRM